MTDPTPIELYAIKLVGNGARAYAEDDRYDADEFPYPEEDWEAARKLALRIADAIRANPRVVLDLAPPPPTRGRFGKLGRTSADAPPPRKRPPGPSPLGRRLPDEEPDDRQADRPVWSDYDDSEDESW